MKTILLTGSTGGLGSVLAKKIIEKRCGTLICFYRNEDKFQNIFGDCRNDIYPYKTTQEDEYKEIENIISQNETDEIVLIMNAFSIEPIKLIGEYTYDDMNQMINGNIKQNIVLLNEIVRICKKCSYKLRVINLDSGAADFPLSGWGNYCASKAYMNAFLSVLSLENQEYKVVSYDPGVMDTDMQRKIRETDKRVFDQVEKFIAYKENNQLSAPSAIAEQLIERYISNWMASAAREKCRL